MTDPSGTDVKRLAKARSLFEDVRALTPEDQETFLIEHCAGDDRLFEMVRRLLKTDNEPNGMLDTPRPPGVTLGKVDAGAGSGDWDGFLDQIGSRGPNWTRYKDQGVIGAGGMGVVRRVYDQDLRRTLAMKRIVPEEEGVADREGSDAELSRFLEEAQVTAQLDHPGIVAVHEVSVDSEGCPYFTMKEVRGEDLRAVFGRLASGEGGWNLPRVLSMILKVCDAMAYAHAKRVIHRDLKPANVMVGRYGQVYVVDWGLARVLGRKDSRDLRIRQPEQTTRSVQSIRRRKRDSRSDSPLVTMDGTVMGTPYFMSPEQALGELDSLGPPSDVYALGCMMYQAVTGTAPWENLDSPPSPYMVLNWVREMPPPRVSDKVRHAPVELTAIIEKAMARRQQDRYPDMTALGEDLRAYLENRVVAAYESGPIAELRKWTRRNRAFAAAIMAALLAIVGGLAGISSVQARRSRDNLAAIQAQVVANEKISAEATRSAATLEFLREMLASADPSVDGRKLTVVDVLDAAAYRIETEFSGRDDVRVALLSTIGVTYTGLGLYDAAQPHLRTALDLAIRDFGPSSIVAQRARNDLAELLVLDEQAEEAAGIVRSVAENRVATDEVGMEERLRALAILARVDQINGAVESAIERLEEVVRIRTDRHGPEHAQTLAARGDLIFARALAVPGRDGRSEQDLREEVARRVRAAGSRDPHTLNAKHDLVVFLFNRERFADAREIAITLVEERRERLGARNAQTLKSREILARTLEREGNLAEAEQVYRELWQHRIREGIASEGGIEAIDGLARCVLAQERLEEAVKHYRTSLIGHRERFGRGDGRTIKRVKILADLLMSDGRTEEAIVFQRELVQLRPGDDLARDTLEGLETLARSQKAKSDLALPGAEQLNDAVRQRLEPRWTAFRTGNQEVWKEGKRRWLEEDEASRKVLFRALIFELRQKDQARHDEAIVELEELDVKSLVPSILEALRKDPNEERTASLEELLWVSKSIQPLLKELNGLKVIRESDPRYMQTLLRALIRTDVEQALEVVENLMKRWNGFARRILIGVLRRVGEANAEFSVVALTNQLAVDPDADLRILILDTLAQLKRKDSLVPIALFLRGAIEQEYARERTAAVHVLREVSGVTVDGDDPEEWLRVARELSGEQQ